MQALSEAGAMPGLVSSNGCFSGPYLIHKLLSLTHAFRRSIDPRRKKPQPADAKAYIKSLEDMASVNTSP